MYFLSGWDQIFLEYKFVHSLTDFYKKAVYWLWFCLSLRIHWRHSTILKQKAKSNVSSYAKVCIFWNWIQYTIHWDKTQMLKKIPLHKINNRKNALFFLLRSPTHHSFVFNLRFLMRWSPRFVSLKLRVEFCIFDCVPFLIKFIFLFNKIHEPFDFKTS